MALLPAHQRLLEDDVDEEYTDEQIRGLLDDAAQRIRHNQSDATPDVQLRLPKLEPGHITDALVTTKGAITRLDASSLVNQKERALANGFKKIEDPIAIKKQKEEDKKATAGSDWFNLPRTDLTPELRRDLQLLKMRNVLDAKRHYKKSDSKSDVPAYSQVGTVIEGPTEFYNSRIANKDRKRTFVEEVLAQEESSGKFKRKYDDILKSKSSGKKAFYKALQEKRSKGKVVKP
ncbi:unnamed protein product [Periconia digitata]|uniref:Fcf2 pre-rRNA processing C-terminal domain-containing protein n=1 Tax=Periconia digitata TaxID=1303443 RepID=A0A9W4XLU1_9PLEO|nr:unnamed protein product [Periconia digitata]